jgi:hypothetical protein
MKKTAKKTAKTKKPAKATGGSKKAPKLAKSKDKAVLAQKVAKLAGKVVARASKMMEKAATKAGNGKPEKQSKAAAPAAAGIKEAGKGKGSKADKKAELAAQLAAQVDAPEVVLTNAEGKQYCRVHDCDNASTTDGYCRFHYLALWKRNKIKAKILQGGKLDKYIEDLTNRYPDKYLEMLRKDLSSEKDFAMIVAEMDIEDGGEEAEGEEEASRFIEEVRGGVPATEDDEGSF